MPRDPPAVQLRFPEPCLPPCCHPAGEEVTGIMAPVSICMALTVILVRLLNPDGSASSSSSVIIASIAYNEDVSAYELPC